MSEKTEPKTCEFCKDWPNDLKTPGLIIAPVTAVMEDATTLVIRCFLGDCDRELARVKVRPPPSLAAGCQACGPSCNHGFPLFLHGRCHMTAPSIIEVQPDRKLHVRCYIPSCAKTLIVLDPEE